MPDPKTLALIAGLLLTLGFIVYRRLAAASSGGKPVGPRAGHHRTNGIVPRSPFGDAEDPALADPPPSTQRSLEVPPPSQSVPDSFRHRRYQNHLADGPEGDGDDD